MGYNDDIAGDDDLEALAYLVDHRPEQRDARGDLVMSTEEFARRDERYRAALSKIVNRPSMARRLRILWRNAF